MEFDREKYVRQLLEREHNGLITYSVIRAWKRRFFVFRFEHKMTN